MPLNVIIFFFFSSFILITQIAGNMSHRLYAQRFLCTKTLDENWLLNCLNGMISEREATIIKWIG